MHRDWAFTAWLNRIAAPNAPNGAPTRALSESQVTLRSDLVASHEGDLVMDDVTAKARPPRPQELRSSLLQFVLDRPALTIAIVISAITFVGLITVAIVAGTLANDFSVYWRTANEMPGSAYLPRTELPFPYAPTMMIWIAPLSVIGLWPAFAIFVAASIAALFLACWRHLTPAEFALLLFSPPLINGLATGQVSAVLAALLLWAVTTDRRIAAGMAFAVVASIKPQIVLLAPLMLLLNRDWRAFVSSALCFLFLIVASIALFGWQRWPEWIGSMANFRSVLHAEDILPSAATPASAAEGYGFAPLPFLIGGIIIGIWLIFRCRDSAALAKCAAIACASLLAAPYALTYDLAPIMPMLVALTFRGSIASAIAFSGALHPIPLLLAAFSLNKAAK